MKKEMIKGILPLNTPWVGTCAFTKAVASLILKKEQDKYAEMEPICVGKAAYAGQCRKCDNCLDGTVYAHRERLYKTLLAVTGCGFTNAYDPNQRVNRKTNPTILTAGTINQSYYALPEYAERAFAHLGYSFTRIDNTGADKAEMLRIITDNRANDTPILACYADSTFQWQLISGYDAEKDTLYWCKGNQSGSESIKGDWYQRIDFMMPITGKTRPRQSLDEISGHIVSVLEQQEYEGIPTGFPAYEAWLALLTDDAYFTSSSDNRIKTNYKMLHYYLGYHAEARCFAGDGLRLLAIQQNAPEKLLQCGELGWQHHDLSYIGWNAMNAWPYKPDDNYGLLRNKDVRGKIIDCIRQLMENDQQMLALIKSV